MEVRWGEKLVDRLITEQGDRTDEQYAGFLGVSRGTWSLVRRKKLQPDSRKFIPAVMRAYKSNEEITTLAIKALMEKESANANR